MLFFLTALEQEDIPRQEDNALYEALLAQIASGDVSALEAFYRSSKTAVYGFALSILKNPAAAEDVMQEAYVTVFRAAGQYRPQGKPMAWMLTIVRNLALMQLRKNRHILEEHAANAAPVQHDFTESSLDRMVLESAMAHLGNEERQIVILHSVSGLKHREIAALLEMPLSTVLSKYRRALAKLQKAMEEEKL